MRDRFKELVVRPEVQDVYNQMITKELKKKNGATKGKVTTNLSR